MIERDNAEENGKPQIKLENESLWIDQQGSIVYLGGEGKISRNDFVSLLTSINMIPSEVSNIIICDGIDEIGYNVFCNMKYLETLKFGKDVQSIDNGAIKDCTILEYVYIPKDVQYIGRDCLNNCGKSIVVTDAQNDTVGGADKIQDMISIKEDSIYYSVTSYEELLHQIMMHPVYSFDIWTLPATDPNAKREDNTLFLEPGVMQGGPNQEIQKGEYQVCVLGKGFAGLKESDIYCTSQSATIEQIEMLDDLIKYKIDFKKADDAVEFILNNSTNNTVEIEKIELYGEPQIPLSIKLWWEKTA